MIYGIIGLWGGDCSRSGGPVLRRKMPIVVRARVSGFRPTPVPRGPEHLREHLPQGRGEPVGQLVCCSLLKCSVSFDPVGDARLLWVRAGARVCVWWR